MLALSLLALLAADPRFVAASTANVRASPDAKAEVVTRLPIGTEVSVEETKGDWVRVKRGAEQGWVLGELLDKEKPTLEKINAKLDATAKGDLPGRRKWAERAAALAPGDVPALARLVDVLTRADDRVALEKARLGLATARGKAGVVSVAATHIYLVYDKSGDFSPCLNEDPEIASGLFNTVIGAGSSGGASQAMALKIEVYGPPNTTPAGRSLEVEIVEGKRVKQKTRQKLGPLDADGESLYDVKITDTGCRPIKIKARLVGPGEPSELVHDVGFECGE